MSYIMVEPGKVGYEMVVVKVIYYSSHGILRLDGHFINRIRTPKKVLETLEKKRINRIGLWSRDVLELGKLNKIKNKPATMNQWFKDLDTAKKFLRRCNITVPILERTITVEDEDARKAGEIKW